MTAPSPSPPPKDGDKHTSIIYFHGMGRPRRYEELSRVIDSLDRFTATGQAPSGGTLRGQKIGVEPSGSDPDPVIFFEFKRFILRPNGKTRPRGSYRLYESYWSPAAAGPAASLRVLLWLLRRAFHPFMVFMHPWRAHQRLKRTYLYRMFYNRGIVPVIRYRQLANLYRDFEGMEARRRFPWGIFGEFLDYIQVRYNSDPQAEAELTKLARRWRGLVLRGQVIVAAIALTLCGALLGFLSASVYLVAFSLHALGVQGALIEAAVARAGAVPQWLSLLSAAVLVLLVIGVGRFLRLNLSDVVFWTTTLEKDVLYKKRREILRAASATVAHVLADARCERIVIVGHSLGTAIAYETLLNLGRRLKAARAVGCASSPWEQLGKISHFLSLGSPIDRISYFFHLTFSRYHRFNRVSDELLGRSADLPFKDDQETKLLWVNVRDAADPIASRLFSPRGPVPNRDEILEVKCSSGHFPSPAAAHTGYFDSLLAAKIVFDTCILGRSSLQLQVERPAWSRIAGRVLHLSVWGLTGIMTWAVGFGGYGYLSANVALMHWAQFTAVCAVAAIFLARLIAWGFDMLHPLRMKS
jgi:hypothetical protein